MKRHVKRITRLRVERRRCDMTQTDLAKRLGLSLGKVHRLEVGAQEPLLSEAIAMGRLFGVPVESFAELVEVPA